MIRKVQKRVRQGIWCVASIAELEKNLDTLDGYLDSKTESAYGFALGLVQRGVCFVARRSPDGWRFYPSRFAGYADNTMERHLDYDEKSGIETNPAISRLLGGRPLPDMELERSYREWCGRLGMEPYGKNRKYWKMIEKE